MGTREFLIDQAKKEERSKERAKAEKRLERERAKVESENHKRAVKMVKSGVDAQLIADIFDMPVEEVEKLK